MPTVNDIHSALNETPSPRSAVSSVEDVQQAIWARPKPAFPSPSRPDATRWAASSSARTACSSTCTASTTSSRSTVTGTVRSRPASSGRPSSSIRRAPGPGGVPWAIRQKQTGADRLRSAARSPRTTAGPHVSAVRLDVQSFTLVDPHGELVCSREENAELFSPVAGGYGLWVRRRPDDAPRPSPNARAGRRGPADRRPVRDVRQPHCRRFPLRRLPVRDRSRATTSPPGRVVAIALSSTMGRFRGQQRAHSGRLEAADRARSHGEGPRVRPYAEHYLATSGQLYYPTRTSSPTTRTATTPRSTHSSARRIARRR